MTTKIQKWGNSLAVRVPRALVHKARLREGTVVTISNEGLALVVRTAKKEPLTLESLVGNIKPQQLHREIDWGRKRGREVW